jgi:hypothetical protein
MNYTDGWLLTVIECSLKSELHIFVSWREPTSKQIDDTKNPHKKH